MRYMLTLFTLSLCCSTLAVERPNILWIVRRQLVFPLSDN